MTQFGEPSHGKRSTRNISIQVLRQANESPLAHVEVDIRVDGKQRILRTNERGVAETVVDRDACVIVMKVVDNSIIDHR